MTVSTINNSELSDCSDVELVSLSLSSSDNFVFLIERYRSKLGAYIKRLTNIDEDDLEDVLQEIFIKVYLNLNDFDSSLKFSSWIYRITHNQVTTTEKSILGTRGQVMLALTVDNVDNTALATSSITAILREEHGLKITQEDDFRIMDAGSMVSAAQESAKTMTALLTAIAAITLLVSGIGIMNVMFVTVAERTKEIGIAKAIGGKRSDILWQFLLESLILSMVGGLIGMGLGQVAIPIISHFNLLAVASSWSGPIIGFTFSVLVGIFFGFYPAYQASRLDPVDALRSE